MTDDDTTVEQDETTQDQVEGADVATEELSEEEQAQAKLKEAIQVTREDIGPLRVKLTVTIPEDTINERRSEQFQELKREAAIPGFRKGHAPLELVEKRFASDVGEDIKARLVGNAAMVALEKEELNALGDPLFWGVDVEERIGENQQTETSEVEKLIPMDKALETMKLPRSGDLTFSCEVELKPEFELPELEKIPVEKPAFGIDDDDVDSEIQRMRSHLGTYKPVTEGAVEEDDLLYAAMRCTVDGNVIESDENFEVPARDTHVKGVRLTGLGEALVGKKAGDTVTIEADVPEDHESMDIRGKKATFEFNISEVKRLDIPPVDEDFLSSVGLESEEELRDHIRGMLEADVEQTLKRGMREQVGAYLVNNTKMEVPEGLSQRQTDRSVARRMMDMYQMGLPEAEIKKYSDEMRAKAHDQAVYDLKLFFILERIAEDREIEVPEEQINAAIAQIARRSNKRFDRVRDELSKGEGLMTLYLQLRDQQVMDQLLEKAEITEIEGPKKKSKAKAAKKATTKAAKDAGSKAAKSEEPKAAEKTAAKKTTAKKTTAKSTEAKAAKKTAKKTTASKKTAKKKS